MLKEYWFLRQVYIYSSTLEKITANEECCGLNKISKGLGCCNFHGYNPYTHVCADFSSMDSGKMFLFWIAPPPSLKKCTVTVGMTDTHIYFYFRFVCHSSELQIKPRFKHAILSLICYHYWWLQKRFALTISMLVYK